MAQLKSIKQELAAAAAAWRDGNEGKSRVCARRAVALADEAWLIRQARPVWFGDAMAHLRRIQQEDLLPSAVRQAAERLTTAVTHQQTAPFTLDPVVDAQVIVDCLMPGGESVLYTCDGLICGNRTNLNCACSHAEEALAMSRARCTPAFYSLMLSVLLGIGAPSAWANPAQDRLAAMPEVERSEALAVFVESGGHSCRTVARTFFQGEDAKGNVFWDVECAGGESFVVVIKNDVPGSTRVMSCRRLRAVAGADCFKKLE